MILIAPPLPPCPYSSDSVSRSISPLMAFLGAYKLSKIRSTGLYSLVELVDRLSKQISKHQNDMEELVGRLPAWRGKEVAQKQSFQEDYAFQHRKLCELTSFVKRFEEQMCEY